MGASLKLNEWCIKKWKKLLNNLERDMSRVELCNWKYPQSVLGDVISALGSMYWLNICEISLRNMKLSKQL
jgi:hypothetical protein